MEVTAYHLLYDNIHDFKTTAMHVESEIRRHGLRDNSLDAVPGMNGRTHHDMWVSMKTVSHFNLGLALELMLKLLLFLNNVPLDKIPRNRRHCLTTLYDAIPAKYQKQLESTYQASRGILLEGYELISVHQRSLAYTRASWSAEPRHIESQGVLRVFRRGRHTVAEALLMGTHRRETLSPLPQRHLGVCRIHQSCDAGHQKILICLRGTGTDAPRRCINGRIVVNI